MSGGLVQITNYGSHDIMLTNNPEITFFRTIFRRYTNFGKIFVETKFDNPVSFNTTSVLNIPKAYDLLTDLILKIKLPKFDFSNLQINTQTDNSIYYVYYKEFLSFKNQLLNIVNNFFNNVSPNSLTYIEDLNTFITNNMTEAQFITFFEIVQFYFEKPLKNIKYYTNASLYQLQNDILRYIYDTTTFEDYNLELFKNLIYANMTILDELNVILYDILLDKQKKQPNVIYSWKDKIGIYLFEYFEMSIGSNQIVKLSPNYVDMYGQLTYQNPIIYDAMINDIQNVKRNYINEKFTNDDYVYLKVPFWFCQNYGLAFPLVSLQFNDLQFKLKTKNIIDCINITFPNQNREDLVNQQFLNNLNKILSEELQISVLLEYASLDSNERQKFVQSGHEYLITQVQEISFTNVSPFNATFDVNMFHCVKDLYWNIIKQPTNIYNNNTNVYYETVILNEYNSKEPSYIAYLNELYNPFIKFNTFIFINGLYTYENLIITGELTNEQHDYDVSIVLAQKTRFIPYAINSSIILNSVSLINQPYNYFNYVQTYNYYNSIPQLGTNVYSFSLYPNDVQPSGSCNIGRIPKVTLNLQLLKYDNNNQENNYLLRLYGTNYNILRIIGGICGLAYQY